MLPSKPWKRHIVRSHLRATAIAKVVRVDRDHLKLWRERFPHLRHLRGNGVALAALQLENISAGLIRTRSGPHRDARNFSLASGAWSGDDFGVRRRTEVDSPSRPGWRVTVQVQSSDGAFRLLSVIREGLAPSARVPEKCERTQRVASRAGYVAHSGS